MAALSFGQYGVGSFFFCVTCTLFFGSERQGDKYTGLEERPLWNFN